MTSFLSGGLNPAKLSTERHGQGEAKKVDHPFGRENEVSVRQLFKFFCNNLHLGQWELARACIGELHDQRELLQRSVKDILRSIAENPYGYSHGSEGIATPHHLSWLCFQEYAKLDVSQCKQLVRVIRQDVEFRLLLVEACHHSSLNVIKELYKHHRSVFSSLLTGIPQTGQDVIVPLPCQEFLSSLLMTDPALGHALLQHLTGPQDDKHFQKNNSLLHLLHLRCLQDSLTELRNFAAVILSEKTITDTAVQSSLTKQFTDLLCLFDPKPSITSLPLTLFLEELCQFLSEDGVKILSIEVVYSALLGRKDTFLLEAFCKVQHDHQMRVHGRVGKSVAGEDEIFSQLGHEVLGLCHCVDRDQAWKDLYLASLNHNRHFLDLIMETAMNVVKTGKFHHLSAMLSPDELRPLRPLVLLVGWDHCTEVEDAKQLLQALGDWQGVDQSGMVLDEECCRLSYQVELVQWCLEQVRSLVPLDSSASYQQRASSLLRGLETHSVLRMLHRTIRLQDLDCAEVFNILTNRPVMEQRGKEKQKKEKTVRFSFDDELAEKGVKSKKRDPINVELERDLVIYRSYCATKHFMEAFHFCADTVNWDIYNTAQTKQSSLNRERTQSLLDLSMIRQNSVETNRSRTGSCLLRPGVFNNSTNSSASSLPRDPEDRVRTFSGHKTASIDIDKELDIVKDELESFQTLYHDNVVSALKKAQENLSKIHPLTLRVETLENIFSLLFLTNEDIHEEMAGGLSDSGEEGAVSESRASSRENLQVDPFSQDTVIKLCDSPQDRSSPLSLTCDDNTLLWSTNRRQSKEDSSDVPTPVTVVVEADSSEQRSLQLNQDQQMTTKTTSVGIFSFTTTELKDTSSDIAKKNSGNMSNNSAGSTGSIYKVGFVANEYIVRDILATLKDCLLDLNAAKYSLMGQQRLDHKAKQTQSNIEPADKELETVLSQHVLSSVETVHLQQRIGRLSQYVSEATWRFQLVSHDWLPAEVGKILLEKPTVFGEGFSDEETGGFYSDEDEGGRRKKRRRAKSASAKEGILSAGESESHQLTDDSVTSSSSHTRWHHQWQYGPAGGQNTLNRRHSIIPLMLAERQTLLHMCLRRAKYSQAQQVVKMFGLERASSAAEVVFAEQYSSAVRKLQNLEHSKMPSKAGAVALHLPRLPRPGTRGKVSLSAIANVAAAGVVTVSATSTVDQILSLNLLPSFPPDVLSEIHCSASPLASHIDPKMIPPMIILDLVCVGSKLWESSQNVVEMLKKRLPQAEKTHTSSSSSALSGRVKRSSSQESVSSDQKKYGPAVFGVRDFMELIVQYVSQAVSEVVAEVSERFLRKSVNEALLTGTQPLNPALLRNYGHMMVDVDRCIKRVIKAVVDSKKQDTMNLLQAVRSASQAPKAEKPVIRQAMKHLMLTIGKSVPAEGITAQLLRDVMEPVVNNSGDYLRSLYEHVKALSCLVHESQGDENVSTVDYFKILEEGPTQIMGKLIFVKMLPPASLEDVAQKLHVNLLQIIINNCCPVIYSQPMPAPPTDCIEEVHGKLVLNSSRDWSGPTLHPGTVVIEILTRLLLLMKEYAEYENASGIFTLAVTAAVVTDPRYLQVMATTPQLKYVDVSLLNSREDKLCFYGNLLNLMILHVMLHLVEGKVDEVEESLSYSSSHTQSGLQWHTRTLGGLSRQLSSGSSPGLRSNNSPLLQRQGHVKPSSSAPQVDLSTVYPTSEVDWILLQNKMAYHVGQLGIVSLFDLRHFILRSGLSAPSTASSIIEDRCHELHPQDPWYIYGPQPEPRMLFVISDGHVSSPPLQVLSEEMVLNQLRVAMKDYLQNTVKVDLESNKITLPQLVVSHQTDFVSDYRAGGASYEGLLNLILTQVEGQLADDLRTTLDKLTAQLHGATKTKGTLSVKVEITPYNSEFSYTFDYHQYNSIQPSPWSPSGHHRSASLPCNVSQPDRLPYWVTPATPTTSGGGQDDPPGPDELFHLSPASISYLRLKSDLVATLASLVSVVDRTAILKIVKDERTSPVSLTSLTADTEQDGKNVDRDRDSCHSSGIVDDGETIAEYRHQKLTTNFPVLWQHIQEQIVPLEVASQPSLAGLPSDELVKTVSGLEFGDDVRKAMLSAANGRHMSEVVLKLSKAMIRQREWLGLVKLLQRVPPQVLQINSDLVSIHDFACCCVAYASGLETDGNDTDANDLWRHLLQISDPNTRGRAVLGLVKCWPVDISVELLQGCRRHEITNPGLLKAVEDKLNHVLVYQQITQCARNLQMKAALTNNLTVAGPSSAGPEDEDDDGDEPITMETGELTNTGLERLCVWQNVMTDTRCHPERILQVLLQSNEYETARRWAAMHDVEPHLLQDIERRYITFLLEGGKPNCTEAFQVLEGLQSADSEECVRLCDDLLQDLTNKANTLFVASYMIQHLHSHLNKYRLEDLYLLTLGCKALLCLPDTERENYDHLVPRPALLLEQLLMNRKVDWARQVLTGLRSSLNPSVTLFNLNSCDELLVKYAAMALEFSILQPEVEIPAMTRSESRASISSQASQISYASQQSTVVAPRKRSQSLVPAAAQAAAAASRGFHKSQSGSRLSLIRAQTPGALSFGPSIPRSQAVSPRTSQAVRLSPNTTVREIVTPSGGMFVMPVEPPSKDQWVADSAAKVCMVCNMEHFSMFVRRHHCRRCGRVVCGSCSTRTMVIQGASARACDQCYAQSFRRRDADEPARLQKRKEKLSGQSDAMVTPPGGEDLLAGVEFDLTPGASFMSEYVYVLSLDDDLNEATREEFYYDQAPSISLCLSILELHSNPQQCGIVILQLCDDVSRHLQPLSPGVKNPEVDYGFVVSMLKYLLFNAKVKFLQASDNQGVGQCDIYLGRLDIVKHLVTANCAFIPSMQQMTKMDSLRRLRDKLIEEERLPLAMDVSTKCGIDPAGVWGAWGLACLRAGDFATARDKFVRCLKAPVDRNQTQQSSQLLTDIIQQLERGPPPISSQTEGLLAPLGSIRDLLAEPPVLSHSESNLEEPIMKECLYYLSTYGTHINILNFYLRHHNLSQAIHYILDKRCTKEVFLEGVVMPCLRVGQLAALQDHMVQVDPTLDRWRHHLTAMCRHFDKNKLINTLYQTQLFIKDFIRAAMTCITYFYQRGALGYSELFSRLQHLLNAKHHMEAYLGERQWGESMLHTPSPRLTTPNWGRRGSQPEVATLKLIMTPGEVNKYVNTINLQIDVTKFLHRYTENVESVLAVWRANQTMEEKSRMAAINAPPTLFGSTRMKADVANLVLFSGNNVNDGFGLAFRIIQDFKLDATFIYVQAGRYFSRQYKYNSVRQLLSCIKDSGLCTDQGFDEVIGACVKVIADDTAEAKEAETLIKMIRSDANKINAYITCGKLRSAYLMAVKADRVEDIRRICAAAERAGQAAVKKICDKWLQGRQRAEDLVARR